MDKPNALSQLLEELRSESRETSVTTIKGSHAQIFLTAGGDPLTLSREECELLLNSPETVEMMLDSLGSPADAAIELHLISVEDEVQDALERSFAAVDDA